MAKSPKFGKIVKETKANVIAKKDEFVEQLKSDPFAVIDVTEIVEFINDPIGVLADTITDPEFIGSVIATALDCVPGVGPFLSSIFSHFWPKDPAKAVVTKEELDNQLKEFKKEMEAIMDSKIAESEIKTWKNICESFFNGLTANMEVLKDKIAVLKKRLKEGNAESSLKTYVREALETMRVQVKMIIEFCASNSTLQDTTKYYMDCLFIYIVIMKHLDSFWFQLDIDEYFVTGCPAQDDEEPIKSFRERINLVLVKGINDIAEGESRNLNDRLERNKQLDTNANKLLKLNPLLYPVKLIESSEKMIPFTKKYEDIGKNLRDINLPDINTAYIYRVDGAAFCPNQGQEHIMCYRLIPYAVEPISGCLGIFNSRGAHLTLNLPTKRIVQVRVFGIYYYEACSLKVNFNFIANSNKFEPLNCADANLGLEGVKSGMYMSKIMYTNRVFIEFGELYGNGVLKEKILFVEVIVHDSSQEVLEEYNDWEEEEDDETPQYVNRETDIETKFVSHSQLE